MQGDLSKVEACERTVDAAAEALGGLDTLVNNAGVTRTLDFLDTDEETYDSVFDLNMKGYFFLARRAVPLMMERGGGSIVNITSVHGFAGFPNHTAYAATKGAINAFTRQLAIELTDRKVRVNAVGPGIIEVPRYFDIPNYTTEFGNTLVPWGRVGYPEDVAPAVPSSSPTPPTSLQDRSSTWTAVPRPGWASGGTRETVQSNARRASLTRIHIGITMSAGEGLLES